MHRLRTVRASKRCKRQQRDRRRVHRASRSMCALHYRLHTCPLLSKAKGVPPTVPNPQCPRCVLLTITKGGFPMAP